ncbi:pyridoxamine 5'-phosphate oxidase [Enemella evansiae]|uniref:pyridoxamine 5'-phosphate oxidase family protein n=1 Tax=Enemella evansiae TaxID=2016499 RepID=UPI000B95EA9B|nr:pyridoxamine 5'-phosphate oxidase family protein [Enemella evansiae]OYN99477.1 pyridoxamine 5'-phosphate oxidase [Enemella evansiae]
MSRRPDCINRHPERARTERAQLDAVLDAGHHFGSLSTVLDGRPLVVPMFYGRDGDRIVMHGSTGAGALRLVAEGAPAALCVSLLDGWVYGHTLFDSSANYRSAVVHGALRTITGAEAAEALTTLSEQLMPGRAAEVPEHTRKQLAATQCLTLPITDGSWTVKVRAAPPGDPEPGEQVDPRLWTGVLPIEWGYGEPVSAPRATGLPVSPSVRSYAGGAPGSA